MLFKALIVTLASSVFATATTTLSYGPPKSTPEPISQCNTGNAQCCNSTQKATDPEATKLLGLLGVVVEGVDVLVGLTCSPISVIGPKCAHQPVCCENNNFNGLINIGCTPISL